jgi:periplasmic protein TonB
MTAVKAARAMALLLVTGSWAAVEAQTPRQPSPGATVPPFPGPSPTSGGVRNVAGQPGLPPIVSGDELLTKYDNYRERIEAKVAEMALSLTWDDAPQVTRRTLPLYPPSAFVTKTEGTVLTMFVIDDTGQVIDVEVLESHKGLDDAAQACVKTWRFKPARKGGQPVGTLAVVAMGFRIY